MQEMRARYLKERDPSISRLVPQVKYWEEDLPEQDEEQPTVPRLIRVNKINDTWMEIPVMKIYGGGLWLFAIISLFPIPFIYIFMNLPAFSQYTHVEVNFSIFIFIFLVWLYFGLEWLYLSPRHPCSL